jgi:hypothetical protein
MSSLIIILRLCARLLAIGRKPVVTVGNIGSGSTLSCMSVLPVAELTVRNVKGRMNAMVCHPQVD